MLTRHPKEKENKVASRETVIMVGSTKVQSTGETRIKKLQSTIQLINKVSSVLVKTDLEENIEVFLSFT